MDRRQRKTREAIFNAFTKLLSKKAFNQITVGEIIEKADIGRATFYSHFETKDFLLKEFCEELFCHIFDTESEEKNNHTHIFKCDGSDSVFLHLFEHFYKNDNNILALLSSQNNELFLRYFKENLEALIDNHLTLFDSHKKDKLPESFWKNHIVSTFVETLKWWINRGAKESPRIITEYFFNVIWYITHIDYIHNLCYNPLYRLYFKGDKMIILITGASHTGKTALAQKLLEKHKYPYLSIDHLKMGLFRSGNTTLTPMSNDADLTAYLWPIVCEMIKTAIENNQSLIIEGCYIPFDYEKYFAKEYLKEIKYYCLVMSEGYIKSHFDDIKKYANVIENRLDDSDCTMESALNDNAQILTLAKKHKVNYILIDSKYKIDL